MNRIPLQTLPTFVAVAQGANIRAVAEQLHVTHSAVSQQIKLLEEQIGFALFDRRARRLVLSAAGEALLAAVAPALAQINEGMRVAGAVDAGLASGGSERIRISVLPSFAQQWLLPRMTCWHALHPLISLELHASLQLADIQKEGFHAGLRYGLGPWRGLQGERLMQTTELVVLCEPKTYERIKDATPAQWAQEALIGKAGQWERWFASLGHRCRVQPVASFNDAGLMLQAAEQGLGIVLSRDLLASDALSEGRLKRLSPHTLSLPDAQQGAYWLVYPPELADWPPLMALQDWLRVELKRSLTDLKRATVVATSHA